MGASVAGAAPSISFETTSQELSLYKASGFLKDTYGTFTDAGQLTGGRGNYTISGKVQLERFRANIRAGKEVGVFSDGQGKLYADAGNVPYLLEKSQLAALHKGQWSGLSAWQQAFLQSKGVLKKADSTTASDVDPDALSALEKGVKTLWAWDGDGKWETAADRTFLDTSHIQQFLKIISQELGTKESKVPNTSPREAKSVVHQTPGITPSDICCLSRPNPQTVALTITGTLLSQAKRAGLLPSELADEKAASGNTVTVHLTPKQVWQLRLRLSHMRAGYAVKADKENALSLVFSETQVQTCRRSIQQWAQTGTDVLACEMTDAQEAYLLGSAGNAQVSPKQIKELNSRLERVVHQGTKGFFWDHDEKAETSGDQVFLSQSVYDALLSDLDRILEEREYTHQSAYQYYALLLNDNSEIQAFTVDPDDPQWPDGWHLPKTTAEEDAVLTYLEKAAYADEHPISLSLLTLVPIAAGRKSSSKPNIPPSGGVVLGGTLVFSESGSSDDVPETSKVRHKIPVVQIPKFEVRCASQPSGVVSVEYELDKNLQWRFADAMQLWQGNSAQELLNEACLVDFIDVDEEEGSFKIRADFNPAEFSRFLENAMAAAALLEEQESADEGSVVDYSIPDVAADDALLRRYHDPLFQRMYDYLKELSFDRRQAFVALLQAGQTQLKTIQSGSSAGAARAGKSAASDSVLIKMLLGLAASQVLALIMYVIWAGTKRGSKWEAKKQVAIEEARQKEYERMGAAEFMEKYAKNLTELAMHDQLDPVLGREEAVKDIFKQWIAKGVKGIAITGEAGVGKSTLVAAVAIEIAKAKKDLPSLCPPALAQLELFELDINNIVSGTKYRGELEDRLKVLRRVMRENPHFRLFIDEGKDNLKSGSTEGNPGVVISLKPDIAKGKMPLLLALTDEDYRNYVATDPQLGRRFPEVRLEEPDRDTLRNILKNAFERQLEHFTFLDSEFERAKIVITRDALEFIMDTSIGYGDQAEPDRSQDIVKKILTDIYLESITTRKSEQPSLVITINTDYVRNFIQTRLRHPVFDGVRQEIRLLLRRLEKQYLIAPDRLGYTAEIFTPRPNEADDVYLRRLRNLIKQMLQLERQLQDGIADDPLERELTAMRAAFREAASALPPVVREIESQAGQNAILRLRIRRALQPQHELTPIQIRETEEAAYARGRAEVEAIFLRNDQDIIAIRLPDTSTMSLSSYRRYLQDEGRQLEQDLSRLVSERSSQPAPSLPWMPQPEHTSPARPLIRQFLDEHERLERLLRTVRRGGTQDRAALDLEIRRTSDATDLSIGSESPLARQEGESVEEFVERIRARIADMRAHYELYIAKGGTQTQTAGARDIIYRILLNQEQARRYRHPEGYTVPGQDHPNTWRISAEDEKCWQRRAMTLPLDAAMRKLGLPVPPEVQTFDADRAWVEALVHLQTKRAQEAQAARAKWERAYEAQAERLAHERVQRATPDAESRAYLEALETARQRQTTFPKPPASLLWEAKRAIDAAHLDGPPEPQAITSVKQGLPEAQRIAIFIDALLQESEKNIEQGLYEDAIDKLTTAQEQVVRSSLSPSQKSPLLVRLRLEHLDAVRLRSRTVAAFLPQADALVKAWGGERENPEATLRLEVMRLLSRESWIVDEKSLWVRSQDILKKGQIAPIFEQVESDQKVRGHSLTQSSEHLTRYGELSERIEQLKQERQRAERDWRELLERRAR